MRISKLISRILISVGIALIVIFVAYEAYNYPFKTIFSRDMVQNDAALPEPKTPAIPFSELKPLSPEGEDSLVDTSAMLVWDLMLSPPFGGRLTSEDIVRMGTIKIPILDISENLFEDSGFRLMYGAGHIRGTAWPGERGNCVIIANRQYIKMRPFRHIDKLSSGDKIIIKTGGGISAYSVYDSFIVTPYDSWVLYDVGEEPYTLTLITGTPLTNPTNRLVVRARLD